MDWRGSRYDYSDPDRGYEIISSDLNPDHSGISPLFLLGMAPLCQRILNAGAGNDTESRKQKRIPSPGVGRVKPAGETETDRGRELTGEES